MATVVIMFLGAMVLHVLGEVFCLFAPSKNNAKTLATTALVLSGATILLNVVGLLIGPFLLVAMLTGLGSLFVFLLFLRAVARCLRDWSLEGSAKNLIIMYAATVAGEFILIIMALILGLGGLLRAGGQNAAVPGDGPGAGTYVLGCLGCVEIILGITSFIWYIVLLVQTRNAISHHLSR